MQSFLLNFSLSRVGCCLGPWLLRPKALEIGFWSSKSAFCPVGTVGKGSGDSVEDPKDSRLPSFTYPNPEATYAQAANN